MLDRVGVPQSVQRPFGNSGEIENHLATASPVPPPPQKEPRAGDLLHHPIWLHRSSSAWIAAALRHGRGLDRENLLGACSPSALPLLHRPRSSGKRSAILHQHRRRHGQVPTAGTQVYVRKMPRASYWADFGLPDPHEHVFECHCLGMRAIFFSC
jgi:hypothetical protein